MTETPSHGLLHGTKRLGSSLAGSAAVLVLLLASPPAQSQEILVSPYLQNASTDSIHVMWETSSGEESLVEWGSSAGDLSELASGSSFESGNGTRVHDTRIEGLSPDTRYWYRAVTGSATSSVYDFITPAHPDTESPTRLVAMSDMQRDWLNPDKFEEIVEDGVIGFVNDELGGDLAQGLDLALVPGDLVDSGWVYSQWAEEFFHPGEGLFSHVPVYPVPGNHENDTDYFFDYFHLPDNGSDGYEEHWWWLDHGNVRVIGLDSNSGYRIEVQLAWLDGVLETACNAPELDFVFAQLHHPHKSELWLAGELDYTGEVIERLEAFSTECGKPSLHFFGHTHGYSRGQSRDHRHLWVNVATAGGNIDYWGEYSQYDYDEFVASHSEWGFVLLEVEAGADPEFRLRRVSRGNELQARDNEVRDDLVVRRFDTPPQTPEALSPSQDDEVEPDEVLLVGSLWSDPDGDLHGATHWQVSSSCTDWSSPLVERWLQYRNEYEDVDHQADDDLTDELLQGLEPQAELCWRLRYRDRGLSWSDWSEPASFRTGGAALGDNLLLNPGAEEGTIYWTPSEGFIESLADGECAGIAPHSGERYFALGALCKEAAYAEASQDVDLAEYAEAISDDRATLHLSGWLANYSGDDRPEIEAILLDEAESALGSIGPFTGTSTQWTEHSGSLVLPGATRSVRVVLRGTRNAGADNDSYIDDLSLRLGIESEIEPGDDDDSAGDDDDSTGDDDDSAGGDGFGRPSGCGCGDGTDQGIETIDVPAMLLPLALLGLGLRRRRDELEL